MFHNQQSFLMSSFEATRSLGCPSFVMCYSCFNTLWTINDYDLPFSLDTTCHSKHIVIEQIVIQSNQIIIQN
ncbi:hypothetical protein Leryth_016261, partial [Lithospermum erythrorhizon]